MIIGTTAAATGVSLIGAKAGLHFPYPAVQECSTSSLRQPLEVFCAGVESVNNILFLDLD